MKKETYISFDAVQNAAFFNDKFKISECLGIRDDVILDFRDKMIFLSYLQQGLFKRDVLNSPRFDGEPGCLSILTGYAIIAGLIELREIKRQEKSLSALESATEEYIERYYSFEGSKLRARNIQLAVNEMIARSTSYTMNPEKVTFHPDAEYLEQWGKRWAQRIVT